MGQITSPASFSRLILGWFVVQKKDQVLDRCSGASYSSVNPFIHIDLPPARGQRPQVLSNF